MNRRDLLRIGAGIAIFPAPAAAQPTAAWTPQFFDSRQNDTITGFADLLIPKTDTPGAKEALVNRYLDKLLAASDPSFQAEFSADLEALDRFSRQAAGDEFVRLTPDQQKSVLGQMPASADRASFDRLKAWTARIYYATEAGFEELNKSGVPASFACGNVRP